MQKRHLILIALLALGACVAPPPPPPQAPKTVSAPPAAVAAPTPKLAGDWNDWPFTPGDWTYRRDGQGSVGIFGAPGQGTKVSLRCEAQKRHLYLSREVSVPGQRIIVRTSSTTKDLSAKYAGGAPGYIAAEIAPNDPILDAMAFSRGRILLETEGQPPIILPTWAEITRIVEDCRG